MRHSVNPNTPGAGSPKDMGSPKKLALILQLVLHIKHNHDINKKLFRSFVPPPRDSQASGVASERYSGKLCVLHKADFGLPF